MLFVLFSLTFVRCIIRNFEYDMSESRVKIFGGSLFDLNLKVEYSHTPEKSLNK